MAAAFRAAGVFPAAAAFRAAADRPAAAAHRVAGDDDIPTGPRTNLGCHSRRRAEDVRRNRLRAGAELVGCRRASDPDRGSWRTRAPLAAGRLHGTAGAAPARFAGP